MPHVDVDEDQDEPERKQVKQQCITSRHIQHPQPSPLSTLNSTNRRDRTPHHHAHSPQCTRRQEIKAFVHHTSHMPSSASPLHHSPLPAIHQRIFIPAKGLIRGRNISAAPKAESHSSNTDNRITVTSIHLQAALPSPPPLRGDLNPSYPSPTPLPRSSQKEVPPSLFFRRDA